MRQAKYMPDFRPEQFEKVYFSGKEAEEVGFSKFHQRQAQLRGIHVLVLDHMRIFQSMSELDADSLISELCSEITDLDLSFNLFTSLDDVSDICRRMPKLRRLTLDGNRLRGQESTGNLPNIRTLGLASTLLEPDDLRYVLEEITPSIEELDLSRNEMGETLSFSLPANITSIDLSENVFQSVSDLSRLWRSCNNLKTLILKHNHIAFVTRQSNEALRCPVEELDLSYNAISTFSFFDFITTTTFPYLSHLRVTGNPLYQSLVSAEGKPLTAADGYMLTIARLPQLEYLNYAKITEKERLNAETYYLGQIAVEIANSSNENVEAVISRHPRYHALCEEYGEPNIVRSHAKDTIDPNSLAARLVSITFTLRPETLPSIQQRSWTEAIPKAFPIYAVLGLVAKRLREMPLDLRLILETNEQDPVGMNGPYNGPEWWDSSDEEEERDGSGNWIKREVELVASTRALSTYIDGHEAVVRVEAKGGGG